VTITCAIAIDVYKTQNIQQLGTYLVVNDDLAFSIFDCDLTLILSMYSLVLCFVDTCFICTFYCKIGALVIGSLKATYLLTYLLT